MKSKSISDITVIMIQYCLKKGRNKEMKTIKQAKVFYVICSVLLCIVGVLLIIFPNVSAITLCYVIGTIAALCGVAKIVGYFSHDLYNLAFQFDLALGIFMTAVGAIMLISPEKVTKFFSVMIGLFVMVDGVFKLQTAVDAKRFGLSNWWLILIGALLCVAFSLILIIHTDSGSGIMMILVGISLLIDGIQNLFNAL